MALPPVARAPSGRAISTLHISVETDPERGTPEMIKRPDGMSRLEFTVLASLRAAQLARGCTPRVSAGNKITVTAQREVAAGVVVRQAAPPVEG